MSYEVDTADDSFNYTSNMAPFFKDFGAYPPSWDGKRAGDVAASIQTALLAIIDKSERELQEYDSPNGWGDWLGAMAFLVRVRDSCRRNPGAEIRESH